MKLYALPPSPNTIKVIALANHLGLELELVPVDVRSGENRTPEYLGKNPNGLTPLLEDGEFCLWESNAILMYLAQKAKSPLVPTDLRGQADLWRWMSWGMGHWNAALRPFLYENIVKPMFRGEQPDPAVIKKGEEDFKPLAGVLDAHLASHKFVLGENVSVADFALAVNLIYAQPANVPIQQYANIQAWFTRVSGLKGWKEAIPEMAAR